MSRPTRNGQHEQIEHIDQIEQIDRTGRVTEERIHMRHPWFIAIPIMLGVANCAQLQGPSVSAQTGAIAPRDGASDQARDSASVWHDGERERRIWMDPQLLVELNSQQTVRSSLGQATLAAETRVGGTDVRYWKLEKGQAVPETLRAMRAKGEAGQFSPVWRDSSSPDGPLRFLPGNIVVILDPTWKAEAVTQWTERHNLHVLSHLPFGPNMLLIQTESGLPALDLANQLYRSGEVKAAFPDWLSQKTVK